MTKHTIQDIPPEDRPYEKCLALGAEALTDSELLAVIIRSGTRGQTSVELAREILKGTQNTQGLLGLHHLSMKELMEIRGIGQVKAVQLKCIGELSKRMAALSAKELLDFANPDTIADYYMEILRHEEQELMICMMLNTRNQLLGEEIISKGTVNSSIVSPRELLLAALRYHAVYLIMVHNHPSGDPTPSKEDVYLTRRVEEACKLVDIPLLDHIIIGDKRYLSFHKEGLLTP